VEITVTIMVPTMVTTEITVTIMVLTMVTTEITVTITMPIMAMETPIITTQTMEI